MLPADINILVSYVNMKLRDEYDSLDEMCLSLDEDRETLTERMKKEGWRYDESVNQFVRG